MKPFTLKKAAKAVGGTASGEAKLCGVSIDSRTVKDGELYVALIGENFDGHSFAESAVKNGAAAVMISHDIGVDCPKIKVENTESALMKLASWYRDRFDIPVVGLTGSVGKTTTKEMICAVLGSEKKTMKTQGNLNNQIGVPRTLFTIEEDTEAAVVEMGMDNRGQISALSRCVKPTAAVITNIGVSHMENLGSREGILAAKLEILDGLQDGAPIFLNGDDPYLMSAEITDRPVIYYGINNKPCNYKAENIEADGQKTEFDIIYDGKSQHIVIPTIGKHNVYNATAAFAVGMYFGIKPENAAKGLLSYEPSGMRQRLNNVGGITFIEDCYNASPDSVRAALNTLSDMKNERKIAVLGDMLELGSVSEDAHRDSGIYAAKKKTDVVLTYGERSAATAQSAKEMGVEISKSFLSQEDLADYLVKILKPGDAVLFKASRGMKLENVIKAVYEKLN